MSGNNEIDNNLGNNEMDNGILCLNKKRRYQISKHCIISTMVSS
jgi:hypothetical protein